MFSVVSRFSSPVSLIRLGSFSSGFHSSLQRLPRSAELASEKGSNCNNMTLGAESFQSGSHMTTIIQNFTRVSLISTTTPHWVWLPFRASGLFLDLRTQLLLTLCTIPFTVYIIEIGWTSMRNDLLWYYLQIVYLLRHEARSFSDVT